MAEFIDIQNLGVRGVNVDLNPLQKENNQFSKAQNIIADPIGVERGIKNRPGLIQFSDEANGTILGGTSVPLVDMTEGGLHMFYIGRGPVS